ncbi:uncharacterized protein LOC144449587 [Glandiceps talaboti]
MEISHSSPAGTSTTARNEQERCQVSITSPVERLMESMSLLISGFLVDHPNCSCVEVLNIVIAILRTESKLLNLETIEYCHLDHFPWKLLNDYKQGLSGVHGDNNTSDFLNDLSLDIASRWLGQEFNQMNNTVSKSVEAFKAKNISCIDNLPPAEQLIDTLFPRSMKLLFTTWIGIKRNESQKALGLQEIQSCKDDDQDCGLDSPKESRPAYTQQTFSRYPLVQLILEFAKQTLISGVAHVLYSRLIQQ